MNGQDASTRRRDLDHLHLLSIFHWVVAGLSALFACLPLFHVAFGLAMATGQLGGSHGNGPPAFIGCLLAALGGFLVVLGWSYAIALAVAARSLARHRRHGFCLVVAAVSCLFAPLGTALGVFTIIVLLRDSVRELFGLRPYAVSPGMDEEPPPAPPEPPGTS